MNRNLIAQQSILKSFKNKDNPWQVIGRDLIVMRACGCLRKLGKSKGKGAMDSPSQIKIAQIVANSYCQKHGDAFLLSESSKENGWA